MYMRHALTHTHTGTSNAKIMAVPKMAGMSFGYICKVCRRDFLSDVLVWSVNYKRNRIPIRINKLYIFDFSILHTEILMADTTLNEWFVFRPKVYQTKSKMKRKKDEQQPKTKFMVIGYIIQWENIQHGTRIW